MTGKKIIFYILAAFIAGNLAIIGIQYYSTKNTTALIQGNEKVVNEFNVSNNLKQLAEDFASVENKIRGTITTEDLSYIDGLDTKINAIENNLHTLQKITDDDISVIYIDKLDHLIHKKLDLNTQILQVYNRKGKSAAEQFIATQKGQQITDSIAIITTLIDNTRKNLLTKVTRSIDTSGKKVQQLSTTLIALVLISGLILFWYIINTVRNQSELIRQLNISEKKVRESALLKEKFMANMSHEIRTPMNAILGFTRLLQKKKLDEESRQHVDTIGRSGENLLKIINDILDLSKIEAGMVRIEPVPFSIREVVGNIVNMFRDKLQDKGLQLKININPVVTEILVGDDVRLTQVLVNLVGNAIKFTEKGYVEISIDMAKQTKNIAHLSIAIRDTGIGIDRAMLPGIFERFHQGEDSITRKYGGTGLGLAIVKELISLQHGTIEVESELNKGTTFQVTIPYHLGGQTIAGGKGINKIPVAYNLGKAKILVAEDNAINQTLLRHIFRDTNLDVVMVNDGQEAVQHLSIESFDLILMDIQMPLMDGYTATKEIRETLKLTTPIVAMTAHAFAGEKEKCINHGMNDYISKPIREEELFEILEKFTRHINEQESIDDIAAAPIHRFTCINLDYMKELSNGNLEFERTITQQFIQEIPVEIHELEKAADDNDLLRLKQLAHNMKTTISIMGLNQQLQPYLDELENTELDSESIQDNLGAVKKLCELALSEARQFHDQLSRPGS